MATINGDGGNNSLVGGDGDDTINGLGGDDHLYGAGGADKLDGGDGNDLLNAYIDDGASDTLLGGAGDDNLFGNHTDVLDGGAGHDVFSLMLNTTSKALTLNLAGFTSGGELDLADGTSVKNVEAGTIFFGTGNDKISLVDAVVAVFGGNGDDTLLGTKGSDVLGGGAGNDLINGGQGVDWTSYVDVVTGQGVHINLRTHGAQDTVGAGHDTLIGIENVIGTIFNDTLVGDNHANVLEGTIGADTLTGGKGADTFLFVSAGDAAPATPDHITDLENKDIIDLSQIDANANTAGDDAFTLVSHFTKHAGQAVLSFDGHNTHLDMDINGDGKADGSVIINGDHHDFTNFIL